MPPVTEQTEQQETPVFKDYAEFEAFRNKTAEPEKPAEPVVSSEKPLETPEGSVSKQEEKKPRRDTTAEGRINELTARARQLEQERDEWKAKANPPAKEEPKSAPPPPVGKPDFKAMLAAAPDGEDYEQTHDRYLEARDEWRERVAAEKAAQAFEAEKAKAVSESLVQKIQKASAEKPDFEEVVVHGKWMPKALKDSVAAFMQDADSLDLIYYLAKNPDEVARIAAEKPSRQLLEMGKLEDRISKPAEPEKPTRPPVSSAPPPPTRMGGAAPVEPSIFEAKDYASFERARKKK